MAFLHPLVHTTKGVKACRSKRSFRSLGPSGAIPLSEGHQLSNSVVAALIRRFAAALFAPVER